MATDSIPATVGCEARAAEMILRAVERARWDARDGGSLRRGEIALRIVNEDRRPGRGRLGDPVSIAVISEANRSTVSRHQPQNLFAQSTSQLKT